MRFVERHPRRAIALVVAAGVAARLLVLPLPGLRGDVRLLMDWAERLASTGPAAFYGAGTDALDYLPGSLYLLWALGVVFDGEPLRLAVKALSIPADVGIALLIARLAWSQARPGAAVLGAALWSLSPAAVAAGAAWGQLDSLGALPLLAAVAFAAEGRWALAGGFIALAGMVKPPTAFGGAVVFAAALAEAVRRRAVRPLLSAFASALAVALLLGLPFRVGPIDLAEMVLRRSDAFPVTSLHAFNIWTFVADFFTPDEPYVNAGRLALVAGVLASGWLAARRPGVDRLLAGAALAMLAFYFLPTRVHERFLLTALALLAALAARRGALLIPYGLLTVEFCVSLLLTFLHYRAATDFAVVAAFLRPTDIALAALMVATAILVVRRLVAERSSRGTPTTAPRSAAL